MDISLFCDTYPFEIDGVGTVVKHYAKELTSLGHVCSLVVPKAPGYQERDEMPCAVLHYKGMKLPVARQYRAGVPAWDFSYLRKQRNISVDILHAHSPFGAGAEAVRLARIHDLPLVGTFHSKYYDDFYNVTRSDALSQAGVKLILNFYNACDEVWTVNQSTANVLRGYGYEREIYIMPNGTNTWEPSENDKMRAEVTFGLKKHVPIFLFVGQQNWKKNICHLLEALALYKKTQPQFQLVMVGQGPHQKEIRALAFSLGLAQNVLFTGQIADRQLLMCLYARADLLLFPSLYDNASMAVNEAAASKTPPVLVRGSCTAECVYDGENGFLCADDPKDIARTLHKIAKDGALLARVGECAKETIPISWVDVMQRVTARYQALIDQYDMRTIMMKK